MISEENKKLEEKLKSIIMIIGAIVVTAYTFIIISIIPEMGFESGLLMIGSIVLLIIGYGFLGAYY